MYAFSPLASYPRPVPSVQSAKRLSAHEAGELIKLLVKWISEQPDVFAAMAVDAAIKQAIAADPGVKSIHVVYAPGSPDLMPTVFQAFQIRVIAVPSNDQLPAPAYADVLAPAHDEEAPRYSEIQPPAGAAPQSLRLGGPPFSDLLLPPAVQALPMPQPAPAARVAPISERASDLLLSRDLSRQMDTLTRNYLDGHAGSRGQRRALETNLRNLIAEISRLPNEHVKVHAFNRIHYEMSKPLPPENRDPNDSIRLARRVFDLYLAPAVRATAPPTAILQLMRGQLLAAMTPSPE